MSDADNAGSVAFSFTERLAGAFCHVPDPHRPTTGAKRRPVRR